MMNLKSKKISASTVKKTGKVLKIQCGYNANSGSLASFVIALPVPFMVTITVLGSLTALVSSILLSRFVESTHIKKYTHDENR
jgi:uncharacterized membrane protein (DUF106 family)